MAGSDTNNSWEKIRRNVKDAEVLISQKKYNLSMVKSRQALESMIRTLCENASIGDMDLASSIDVHVGLVKPLVNIIIKFVCWEIKQSMKAATTPTKPIRRIICFLRRLTPFFMNTIMESEALPLLSLSPEGGVLPNLPKAEEGRSKADMPFPPMMLSVSYLPFWLLYWLWF